MRKGQRYTDYSERKNISVRVSPATHDVVRKLAGKEAMSIAKWVEFLIQKEIHAQRDARRRAA